MSSRMLPASKTAAVVSPRISAFSRAFLINSSWILSKLMPSFVPNGQTMNACISLLLQEIAEVLALHRSACGLSDFAEFFYVFRCSEVHAQEIVEIVVPDPEFIHTKLGKLRIVPVVEEGAAQLLR